MAEKLGKNSSKVGALTELLGNVDTTSENDEMFTPPMEIELPEECFENIVEWEIVGWEVPTTKKTRKRFGCPHHAFMLSATMLCVKRLKKEEVRS